MKRYLIALLLVVYFTPSAAALDIPKRPQGYVHDQANMLSPADRRRLEMTLRAYEDATTNQVVVATFQDLEGESLEDFSIRLSEVWKVGQAEKDNGVILLIFKASRKMRIEVGYGLEGALPDALAGQIIQNEIAPRFRAGDYSGGILAGTVGILKATQGEYKRAGPAPYGNSRGAYRHTMSPEEVRYILLFIAALAAVLFFVDIFRFRSYRGMHRIYHDRYSFWEWWLRFGLLLFILSMLMRLLFYSMLLSRGGYYGSRGGYGGGFSGGGGRFGGGGASGGW